MTPHTQVITCPKCEKGELVKRENLQYNSTFYGCSRFKSGCRFIANERQYQQLIKGQTIIDRSPQQPRKFNSPDLPRGTAYPPLIEGTKEQQAIWEAILDGNNVIVDALAGTGKSTVLSQMCARAGEDCFIVIVAFNKRVAEDIIDKLPPNATALTIHKVGYIACQQQFGRLNPTKYKSQNMLSDHYGLEKIDNKEEAMRLSFNIRAACIIISLCKTNLICNPTDQDIDFLITNHGIDIMDYGQVNEMVKHVMHLYLQPNIILRYSIDFDDMINIPVVLNLPVMRADAVAVDEAQDLSAARQALVAKISDQIIVVGDTNQAIYRFTGADSKSMENISALMDNPVRLPLTTNWRCGRKHIQLAQVLVPAIQAHGNAPEGFIYEINEDQFSNLVKPGDMVICRTNAPMIKHVYKLLAQGISATIVGKDIGENLSALIRKLSGMSRKDTICSISLPIFIQKLHNYRNTEAEKLASRRNSEMLIENLNDKVDMIHALCSHSNTVIELLKEIDRLFTEVKEGGEPNLVTFYTVHKAKGAENAQVFILEPRLLPFPKARHEEDVKQELNLLYVAVTRVWASSKRFDSGKLYFVGAAMPEILRSKCAHLIDIL